MLSLSPGTRLYLELLVFRSKSKLQGRVLAYAGLIDDDDGSRQTSALIADSNRPNNGNNLSSATRVV